MGLSYHFKIHAPSSTPVEKLVESLRRIEVEAQSMGFDPTLVVNALFDSSEEKEFARRLTSGLRIQDDRLVGEGLLLDDSVWDYGPDSGVCRIIPEQAIVLIVTDEDHVEYCFGFFRYPSEIMVAGKPISLPRETIDGWIQAESLKSSDARLRKILLMLREDGFVKEEVDEFALF